MKLSVVLGGILGILFLVLAFVYFKTLANSLPSFLPGFDSTLDKVHYKHGVGALLLGLGCFAFAWFQSGSKSSQNQDNTSQDSNG